MRKITFILFIFSFFCNAAAAGYDKYLAKYFASTANPLVVESDLDKIITKAGEHRLFLLGEASHGSAEFYAWRVQITKRLIIEKNFSFIAVEGDWSSIYRLNQYVKNLPGALKSIKEVLRSFNRWPRWMWNNKHIEDLAKWLREYNMNLADDKKIGFYGVDLYEPFDAMDNLLGFVEKYFPSFYNQVQHNLQCFARYNRDEWDYAHAVADGKYSCQVELNNVAKLLHKLVLTNNATDNNDFFHAQQSALVVKNAEDFYRLAINNNTASWNVRAKHMWLSIKRLLSFYGKDSKGIVWGHNTHLGDSRATSMIKRGITNVGALARDELGFKNVFIIGFGTYSGLVSAGSDWEADMEKMKITPAVKNSYEEILSRIKLPSFYLMFDDKDRSNKLLNLYQRHRAIGVVYYPQDERFNYIPTILPWRYDVFIFIKYTNPLEMIN